MTLDEGFCSLFTAVNHTFTKPLLGNKIILGQICGANNFNKNKLMLSFSWSKVKVSN